MAVKHPFELFGGQFPIGVDNQRITTLAIWRNRGANFLVRSDLTGAANGIADFLAAAKPLGFRAIVGDEYLDKVPAAMWGGTAVAVCKPDEPDLEGHLFGVRPAAGWPKTLDSSGNMVALKVWDAQALPGGPAEMVQKWYRDVPGGPLKDTGTNHATSAEVYRLRTDAARGKVPPGTPFFGNVAGMLVNPALPAHAERYGPNGYGGGADWLSQDWYPVNRDPTAPGLPRRYQLWWAGDRSIVLSKWNGGKPAFAHIECGWQREDSPPGGRWPTPAETLAEIWSAIAMGCAGIIYFPEQTAHGYRPDAIQAALTEPAYSDAEKNAAAALADAITAANARISALSPYLTSGTFSAVPSSEPGVYTASWVTAAGQLTIRVNANPVRAADLDAYAVVITEKPAAPPSGGPTAEPASVKEIRAIAEAARDSAAGAVKAAGEAAGMGVRAAQLAIICTADAMDAASKSLRKLAEDLTKPAQ